MTSNDWDEVRTFWKTNLHVEHALYGTVIFTPT